MKQCLGQGSPVLNPGQWICLHGSGQTRHLRNFVNHEEFNTNKKDNLGALSFQRCGQRGVRDQGPWGDSGAYLSSLFSSLKSWLLPRNENYIKPTRILGVGTKGDFYFLFVLFRIFQNFLKEYAHIY